MIGSLDKLVGKNAQTSAPSFILFYIFKCDRRRAKKKVIMWVVINDPTGLTLTFCLPLRGVRQANKYNKWKSKAIVKWVRVNMRWGKTGLTGHLNYLVAQMGKLGKKFGGLHAK